MALNVNDLMVGDWVMCKDYPMREKVTRICPGHFVRSLCTFEPIPLTQDILIKSGFLTFGDAKYYMWNNSSSMVTHVFVLITFEHGDIDVVIRYDDVDVKSKKHKQLYVHELQHIFKAFNLDIELNVVRDE
ncbi:MAG: hypothetical protein J6Y37_02425 [Paludibacteraceae bacterium]|nr:hypothetical protein [Paludibacteraceae bacterium]